jgi:hypothetical protein
MKDSPTATQVLALRKDMDSLFARTTDGRHRAGPILYPPEDPRSALALSVNQGQCRMAASPWATLSPSSASSAGRRRPRTGGRQAADGGGAGTQPHRGGGGGGAAGLAMGESVI